MSEIHKDILGREISVGDYISVVSKGELAIGKVTKLNPKLVQFVRIHSRYGWLEGETSNRPADKMVIIDRSEYVTRLILTKEPR